MDVLRAFTGNDELAVQAKNADQPVSYTHLVGKKEPLSDLPERIFL